MIRLFRPRALAALLFLSAAVFTSCYREPFGIRGAGAAVSETRNTANFDAIESSVDADVVLHTDSVYHVELSAQSNILAVLTTEVHGSTLGIGFRRNVCSHGPITIHVYAPVYTSAALSGSGNIRSSGTLSSSTFSASISGSGNIEIGSLHTGDVHTSISGSGEIRLDGQAQSVTTKTSGSGNTHLFGLAGTDGSVSISGSGNVEINVTQRLDVHISGSGDVYYRNNPSVDADISGSGALHHVN